MLKVRRIRHQAIKVMSWFRKMKKYWESQKVLKVIYSKATSIVGSLVRQTARWSILLSHCYQLIQILLCCVWQAMGKFWGKPRQNPREKSGGSHYLVYLFISCICICAFVFVFLCVFESQEKSLGRVHNLASGGSESPRCWWCIQIQCRSHPYICLASHTISQGSNRQTTLPPSLSGDQNMFWTILGKSTFDHFRLVQMFRREPLEVASHQGFQNISWYTFASLFKYQFKM